MSRRKILCVFGTRPEAIKMAPVVEALAKSKKLMPLVVLTAQHRHMLDQVVKVFQIPVHYDLRIMQDSQSLEDITTLVLKRLAPVLLKEKPDLMLVHGDTTTTLAAALSAYYHKIPVGHVEAGLRSHDRYSPYPEEFNRRLTDVLSVLHFAPTQTARKALLKENISPKSITVTGNTVIDALLKAAGVRHEIPKTLRPACYGPMILVTAHRRENFGQPLENICKALLALVHKYPMLNMVYPVHLNPKVQKPVRKWLSHPRIHLTEPLSYLDFVHLMKPAILILTDSGGLQEEAPSLGKPVLVLRRVTERPEAVRAGTVRVVGTETKKIVQEASFLLDNPKAYLKMARAHNPYGDGHAAPRIVKTIEDYLQ